MDGYEALMELLDKFPTGAPKTGHLRRILEIILTEEEAAMAAKLMPHPLRERLDRLCDRVGVDPSVAKPLLESAADKGVVYMETREGHPFYSTMPLAPGIFELQFMKGLYDNKSKELAKLFDDYYFEGWGHESFAIGEPFARTIVIQEEIPGGQQVQPYEKVRELILNNKKKALTTCFCRHEHELLGKSCGAPKDVCMVLGPFANYAVERGFARWASDEQMLSALDRAEEAGLVHLSDNIAEKVNFVCNCCGCCCGILGTITKLNVPTAVAHSPYLAVVDEDECIGCGDCIDRCQIKALSIPGGEDKVKIELDRCIGCAVCVRACPQNAISMERRRDEDIIKPHDSYFDLGMAIVKSMPKRKRGAGK